MSRLFIIEGPDCSGKSSLAAAICLHRKAMYLHASGKKSLHIVMLDYHLDLIEQIERNLQNGHDVVVDRLWVSEYVYGQILRPHLSDRVYDFGAVLHRLRPLKPTYVFCGDDDVVKRHEEEKDRDHPYPPEIFESIVAMYAQMEMEMRMSPALPLLHPPKTLSMDMVFEVRHYSILEQGSDVKGFVESL